MGNVTASQFHLDHAMPRNGINTDFHENPFSIMQKAYLAWYTVMDM